jgi:hypothetical protein
LIRVDDDWLGCPGERVARDAQVKGVVFDHGTVDTSGTIDVALPSFSDDAIAVVSGERRALDAEHSGTRLAAVRTGIHTE